MKRLVFRSAARDDVLRQVEYYIDQDAFDAAARFPDAVQAGVSRIVEMPGIGLRVPLNNPRLNGLRSWPVPGFEAIRIYYLDTPDAIRVVRILHGMQDCHSVLAAEDL